MYVHITTKLSAFYSYTPVGGKSQRNRRRLQLDPHRNLF